MKLACKTTAHGLAPWAFSVPQSRFFNFPGNVVDVNDEMWYTYCTKYDSGIENTPSDSGRVRKAFSQCSLKPKGALV